MHDQPLLPCQYRTAAYCQQGSLLILSACQSSQTRHSLHRRQVCLKLVNCMEQSRSAKRPRETICQERLPDWARLAWSAWGAKTGREGSIARLGRVAKSNAAPSQAALPVSESVTSVPEAVKCMESPPLEYAPLSVLLPCALAMPSSPGSPRPASTCAHMSSTLASPQKWSEARMSAMLESLVNPGSLRPPSTCAHIAHMLYRWTHSRCLATSIWRSTRSNALCLCSPMRAACALRSSLNSRCLAPGTVSLWSCPSSQQFLFETLRPLERQDSLYHREKGGWDWDA